MVNQEAVNCEQVYREISNYLEGDVDPALRTAMERHFPACKRCSAVLEGMRNVIRLYGDERMMELPVGFGSRLERRLAQNAGVRSSGWSRWSAWLVPVAALALFGAGLRLANSLTATPELKSEHAQPGEGIPPDMLVVVTSGAKLFHAAGCGFIHNKNTERTLTAKEALHEGYVPCLRCMREYLHSARQVHAASGTDAHADEDSWSKMRVGDSKGL
jgi:hypothetical protein